VSFIKEVGKALLEVGINATYVIRAKAEKCVSYHFFGDKVALYGDGKPKRLLTKCQVDIWTTNGQDEEYITPIKEAMKGIGWKSVLPDEDSYQEPDTGIYHRFMIFQKEYSAEEND